MATWKDDLKYAGHSLIFYSLLSGVAICWVVAIILTIVEVSLWIVLGFYLLGVVFFFSINYLSKDDEKKEEEAISEEQETA